MGVQESQPGLWAFLSWVCSARSRHWPILQGTRLPRSPQPNCPHWLGQGHSAAPPPLLSGPRERNLLFLCSPLSRGWLSAEGMVFGGLGETTGINSGGARAEMPGAQGPRGGHPVFLWFQDATAPSQDAPRPCSGLASLLVSGGRLNSRSPLPRGFQCETPTHSSVRCYA